MEVIQILVSTVAPIVCVAALGAFVARVKEVDIRSVSRLVIYFASPALAFDGIANSSITTGEIGRLTLFFFTTCLVVTALGWLVTRLLGLDRLTSSAFILSVALTNIGNYGIPLNEFAFGQPGLERAVLLAVMGGIYAYTMGIFLASSGNAPLGEALKNVFKVPTPYAAVLGLIVNLSGVSQPDFVVRVTGLVADSAVPLMLVILGMQIASVKLERDARWGLLFGASLVRLVGGATVGFVIAWLLGLEGVSQQVAIVQAATPTAVITSILATEFGSDAKFASSMILVSTVLSLVSMPILLFLLTG